MYMFFHAWATELRSAETVEHCRSTRTVKAVLAEFISAAKTTVVFRRVLLDTLVSHEAWHAVTSRGSLVITKGVAESLHKFEMLRSVFGCLIILRVILLSLLITLGLLLGITFGFAALGSGITAGHNWVSWLSWSVGQIGEWVKVKLKERVVGCRNQELKEIMVT